MSNIRQERPGIHPAFPVAHKTMLHSEWNGLSKREYAALHLLGGLLSQSGFQTRRYKSPAKRRAQTRRFKSLAATAISHADELLQQLMDAPV